MPPPAEGLAARLVAGPALRAQSDRRLVTLVREGYEAAFDEIVRRYGRPLRGYAASIVGIHAEDVTQDAFSKALQALRRDGADIELRPWLYRIVRNTALNDLRDRPPAPEALAETIASGRSVAEEVEQRQQLTELIKRLRALPEPQRAAIVMRELEGLGHEEIAAALGLSGGAARQAIYRARHALRDGFGMLFPLPLVKWMISSGGPATAEAAVGVGSAAGVGITLKAAAATVLVAGAVGAGVAIEEGPGTDGAATARAAQAEPAGAPSTAEPARGTAPANRSGDEAPRMQQRAEGADSKSTEDSGSGGSDRGADSRDRGEGHSAPSHSEHSGHEGEEIDAHDNLEPNDDHGSVEDHSGPGGELEPSGDGSDPGESGPGGEESHSGSDSGSGSSEEGVLPESDSGGGQEVDPLHSDSETHSTEPAA